VLGMLAEKKLGIPVDQALQQWVLQPLGLTNTYLDITSTPSNPVSSLANSYYDDGSSRTYAYHMSSVKTAGSVVSTPEDVAKFLRAVYSGNFLSTASLSAMTMPSAQNAAYGLGTRIWSTSGIGYHGHSGTLSGYNTMAYYVPSMNITLALHSNRYDSYWETLKTDIFAALQAEYAGYCATYGCDTKMPSRTNLIEVENKGGTWNFAWQKNIESFLVGYRLYYSENDNLTSWKLVANETTLTASKTSHSISSISQFLNVPTGTPQFFKITAVGQGGKESPATDIYACSTNDTGVKVLVVDGFDRCGKDGSSWNNINHSFVTNYYKALRDAAKGFSINSCANEALTSGLVKLSDYQLVVWTLGDESTDSETFNPSEQALVKSYLENGGRLIVSGSETAWDIDFKGTTNDKAFFNNYLKSSYVDDGASTYKPATGSSTVSEFNGMTINFGVNYTEDYPDNISAVNGGEKLLNYNGTNKAGGVGFVGKFGTSGVNAGMINISFPLETASLTEMTNFLSKSWDYLNKTPSVVYCAMKGNNSAYEWISGVAIGGYSHTSGNDNGYGNYTTQTISLTAGNSYSYSLTPTYASTQYNEAWKIWLDANKDGDFTDAGELLVNLSTPTKGVRSGTLTVPSAALAGTTRLRVAMNGTSTNYALDPCTNFGYGEVQDYTVSIAQSVQVAPVANNDNANTSVGQAVSITVLNNDTDTNNNINAASVTIGNTPTNGAVAVASNGVITYTPNAGFVGSDSFDYTVKDATNLTSNVANVTINVNATPACTPTMASVIVDDASAGYSMSSGWVVSTSTAGYKGTGYYHDNNQNKGTSTVNFSPTITGVYDVYVWFMAGANRPTNAKYRINHDGGVTDVLINQQLTTNNAKWVSLGRYSFTNQNNKVQLRTEGTDGFFVIADAAKFDYAGCPGVCVTPLSTEKIVDNATATLTGSWTTGANAGFYGTNYVHDGGAGQGTKTATFTPNLEQDGSYELFTWYVSGTNRATNIPIDIYTPEGVSTLTLNQQTGGAVWKSLGIFDFNKATAKVTIRTTAANGVVIADAFRWVYKGCKTGTGARIEANFQTLESFEGNLTVYPNPFENEVALKFQNQVSGKNRLEIMDILGRKVFEKELYLEKGANQIQVDAQKFDSGVYLVRLQTADGKVQVGKILKK